MPRNVFGRKGAWEMSIDEHRNPEVEGIFCDSGMPIWCRVKRFSNVLDI